MTLLLLPNLLSENASKDLSFPKKLKDVIHSLYGLIAEDEKNARKYLKLFFDDDKWKEIKIELLNEHTSRERILYLLDLIKKNKWGLVSDAGLCCIADPGSDLVFLARQNNIKIEAFSGPSSIFMALMLSGLHCQKFSFEGYLPREEKKLVEKIKFLEKRSMLENSTQLFIEAPYRSDKLLNILIKTLNNDTILSVASDITGPDEMVITKTIKDLKDKNFLIGKKPSIFLFQAFKR